MLLLMISAMDIVKHLENCWNIRNSAFRLTSLGEFKLLGGFRKFSTYTYRKLSETSGNFWKLYRLSFQNRFTVMP